MTAGVGSVVMCPFAACQQGVPLVATIPPGQPGHDNSAVYQRHKVHPDDWFGTCPASVLGYPLLPHEITMLREQYEVFERVKADRERRLAEERDANIRRVPVPDHPLTPRPFPSSGFGTSTAPESSKPRATARGGTVATTAEVQAAIDAANQVIIEAQTMAHAAADKFDEAEALLAAITAQTGAELGRAPVAAAAADCTSAGGHAAVAVATNDAYKGLM